jgi:hypothetical protein
MIANDGTLVSQSKTADYYQVSQVTFGRELDFKASRLYVFQKRKSSEKTSFLVFAAYLKLAVVFNFQTRIILQLQTLLHQNIHSFIRQSVFINEIKISNNFRTSLYTA